MKWDAMENVIGYQLLDYSSILKQLKYTVKIIRVIIITINNAIVLI